MSNVKRIHTTIQFIESVQVYFFFLHVSRMSILKQVPAPVPNSDTTAMILGPVLHYAMNIMNTSQQTSLVQIELCAHDNIKSVSHRAT